MRDRIEAKLTVFLLVLFGMISCEPVLGAAEPAGVLTSCPSPALRIDIEAARPLPASGSIALDLAVRSAVPVSDVRVQAVVQHATSVVGRRSLVAGDSAETLLPDLPAHQVGRVRNNLALGEGGEIEVQVSVSGVSDGKPLTDSAALFLTVPKNDMSQWHEGWRSRRVEADSVDRTRAAVSFHDRYPAGTSSRLPHADAQLNEVLEPGSAPRVVTSAGTITVQGQYKFYDRSYTLRGFYHNLLELSDDTTGEILSYTYTDDDGYYQFDPVTNPGGHGIKVMVYSVRFLTSEGYGACEYPGCPTNAAASPSDVNYFFGRYCTNSNPSDGTVTMSCTSSFSTTDNLRAFWIKYDFDAGDEMLRSAASITGPYTAEWNLDSHTGCTACYSRGGNMYFDSDQVKGTSSAVLHELGHNAMYNAGSFPGGSDCPSPHYLSRVSGKQCAWTEGWADYFSRLVANDPSYCFPPSGGSCVSFETEPSRSNCGSAWDCDPADWVEGHVAGSLWDIDDSVTDGDDNVSFGISEIFSVLTGHTNRSFSDWYSSWRCDGWSSLATNSIWQNAIDYRTDRVLSVSSANPASGVAITIDRRDFNCLKNGTTSFSRTYPNGAVVGIAAPATADGNAFLYWLRDGFVQVTSRTTSVTMNDSHSMEAVYEQPQATCYALTRSHTGSGSDPAATPSKSSACSSSGQYVSGESISLSAGPSTGWEVDSWSGTVNDSSRSTSNSLTMPASNHTVSVNYAEISTTNCRTLQISNTSLTGTGVYGACGSVLGGPSLTLGSSAVVTLEAGQSVVLYDGFQSQAGASLTVKSCGHDLCSTGGAMGSTCHSCVSSICTTDSSCCDSAWDSICVGKVGSVCGLTCP